MTSAPVARKATRQPKYGISQIATKGAATMPPIPDPLSKIATATPRSPAGNHSETALVADGQLPASPVPSRNRAAQKDQSPRQRECDIAATDQNAANNAMPQRTPMRSTIHPETNCITV